MFYNTEVIYSNAIHTSLVVIYSKRIDNFLIVKRLCAFPRIARIDSFSLDTEFLTHVFICLKAEKLRSQEAVLTGRQTAITRSLYTSGKASLYRSINEKKVTNVFGLSACANRSTTLFVWCSSWTKSNTLTVYIFAKVHAGYRTKEVKSSYQSYHKQYLEMRGVCVDGTEDKWLPVGLQCPGNRTAVWDSAATAAAAMEKIALASQAATCGWPQWDWQPIRRHWTYPGQIILLSARVMEKHILKAKIRLGASGWQGRGTRGGGSCPLPLAPPMQPAARLITHNVTRGMLYSSMLLHVNLDSSAAQIRGICRRFPVVLWILPNVFTTYFLHPDPPLSPVSSHLCKLVVKSIVVWSGIVLLCNVVLTTTNKRSVLPWSPFELSSYLLLYMFFCLFFTSKVP